SSGSAQTFTVPGAVASLQVEAWGAEGGAGTQTTYGGAAGGLGGYARATVAVTASEALKVRVGGAGQTGYQGAGGYNGGGTGSSCACGQGSTGPPGGGGGGAS